MVLKVFLDLDNVCCSQELAFPSVENAAFYARRGAIINASATHYIHPGIRELISLILLQPDMELSFYTAGPDKRNLLFLDHIKTLIKGDPEKIKNLRIYNRLEPMNNEESIKQYERYTLQSTMGRTKKDLSQFLSEEEVENAILIDDNPHCIETGQEGNYLNAFWSYDRNYERSSNKHKMLIKNYNLDLCTEEGMKKIKCLYMPARVRTRGIIKFHREKIVEGKYILIFQRLCGGYEIGFIKNSTGKYGRRVLPLNNKRKSLKNLYSFLEKLDNTVSEQFIYDEKGMEAIHQAVSSFGGRTARVYHRMNRACSIAGRLFRYWEKAKTENVPITEVLLAENFKQHGDIYAVNWRKQKYKDEDFIYGKNLFQQITPSFQFITPPSYDKDCRSPLTAEQKEWLEKAINHKLDENDAPTLTLVN